LVEHRDKIDYLLLAALSGTTCYEMVKLTLAAMKFPTEIAVAFALGAAVTCAQEIPRWAENHY
jgi:hypothetical protein